MVAPLCRNWWSGIVNFGTPTKHPRKLGQPQWPRRDCAAEQASLHGRQPRPRQSQRACGLARDWLASRKRRDCQTAISHHARQTSLCTVPPAAQISNRTARPRVPAWQRASSEAPRPIMASQAPDPWPATHGVPACTTQERCHPWGMPARRAMPSRAETLFVALFTDSKDPEESHPATPEIQESRPPVEARVSAWLAILGSLTLQAIGDDSRFTMVSRKAACGGWRTVNLGLSMDDGVNGPVHETFRERVIQDPSPRSLITRST
jgi:hypothetical protein